MRKLSFYCIGSYFFLPLIIFACYSNTFHASWHLDDHPNIVNNYYLHLNSLHPDELIKTFFTNVHNPEQLKDRPYRPVACLSFALNWYFGQDNVFGYHIVNIAIHILTAFFLFLFVHRLFDTPNLKNKDMGNPVFIALLSSILWAINPIQTQAVTYIVQRMAELAALFYIIGLYAYLKGRLSRSVKQCIIWFLACVICYLLSVNSKPNAAIMPMAIMLVEILFFQDLADKQTRKRIFMAFLAVAVFVCFLGSFVFLQGDPLSFLSWYNTRTFTFSERMLAQPRVIVFYLSQIFYPLPERLSIAHDVVLSSSIFKPWTTIPSILIIFSLIGFSLAQLRKRPILSFAILFFFLNHIIESSVLALEIIFEHRNYLPSFFLFLPLACIFSHLLTMYKHKNSLIYVLVLFCVISIVGFFSVNTHIRNQAWQDDIALWKDAVAKAPNNARASNILAIKLAWGENSTHPKRYDMALKLFKDSLEKHIPSSYVKADIYGNMALIYFHRKNMPQESFACFEKALAIHPGNLKIRRDLVNALILQKKFDEALEHVNLLLTANCNNGLYNNLKGHILVWQGAYDQSLPFFKKAYETLSDKTSVLFNTAVSLSLSGDHEKAELLLLEGVGHYPGDITLHFALVENSIRAEQKTRTAAYIEKMRQQFNEKQIRQGIEQYSNNPKYAPISRSLIEPAIHLKVEEN